MKFLVACARKNCLHIVTRALHMRARDVHFYYMNAHANTNKARANCQKNWNQQNRYGESLYFFSNVFESWKKCLKTKISHSLPSQKSFGTWSMNPNVIILTGGLTDWASSSLIVRNSPKPFSTIHRKPTSKRKTWQASSVSWIFMVFVKYQITRK